jgi:hypothetical protein
MAIIIRSECKQLSRSSTIQSTPLAGKLYQLTLYSRSTVVSGRSCHFWHKLGRATYALPAITSSSAALQKSQPHVAASLPVTDLRSYAACHIYTLQYGTSAT